MKPISAISNAIDLVQRLRAIWKNVSEAEAQNLLANLSGELADAKLETVRLKERIRKLEEENAVLKAKAPLADEKPRGKQWGCYRFTDDPELYCTACWDSKREKSSTTRVNTRIRHCPVCKANLSS